MGRSKNVTAATVAEVKAKKQQYPSITHADLGAMCGTSSSSVGRILGGEYDHLLGACGGQMEMYGVREVVEAISGQLETISAQLGELLEARSQAEGE